MSEMCWDVNPNCMAKAEGPKKQPCPAFEQKKSCWELDRTPFLKQLSEEQQVMMKKWMEENCPQCAVYKLKQKEIDQQIKLMRREI